MQIIFRKEKLKMSFLKKFWPTPFKVKKGDVISLIIQLLIFIVVVAVVGILIGVHAKIPVLGIIFGIIGSLLGVYNIIGIVLCVLKFLDIV